MKQKRHTTEEIIRIIREADADKDREVVCRKHNILGSQLLPLEKEVWGHGAQG